MLSAGESQSELARALLRYAVAEVWGCEMPAIARNSRGKPFFVGAEKMHFSLSHTKTHVLAAVSEYPVGADIETLREYKKDFERLFSPGMLSDFGYFGGWTLREAVFKLRGEGSLRSMDLRLENGAVVSPYEGVRCRLYSLDGCVAAAAAWEGDFPKKPEIVESSKFWAARA